MIKGHQGDVQFRQVFKLPGKANKIDNKPIALGEHSGHQHVLTGDVELFEHEGVIYAAVGSDGARLQHIHQSNFTSFAETKELPIADHKAHELKEGVYEFWIQNEYNPFEKIFQQVID